MNGLRRPNLPGANCSTEGGNIPLESPGWTASCQTLLMTEITQPHTGRFDALFSSSPVQGRTSRRGDHTERLLTFPKRRVGWLHDTIGGFPSNVSFPSPSPHPLQYLLGEDRRLYTSTCSGLRIRSQSASVSKKPVNIGTPPSDPTHQPTGKRYDAVSCANSSINAVDVKYEKAEPPTSTDGLPRRTT